MNPGWKRWAWRGIKLALALVILFFVGWQFQRDLVKLDLAAIDLRPGWLLASGALYCASFVPAAWFWRGLLGRFGYAVPFLAALRAHGIGQLGKYVPGKAVAIAIRCELVHPYGVPYGVSVIGSFYEVFTGMAAGAMLAALIYVVQPPPASAQLLDLVGLEWHPAWMGLALVVLCGIPMLPGVFNYVIAKLTAKIQAIELYRLPALGMGTSVAGLAQTALGWCMQGLSVWAMLQAVLPTPPVLTLAVWAQCTAGIAFATTAGFAIFVIPGGLGIREGLLKVLLSPGGADDVNAPLAAAVLLLRLDWIVAEAAFALVAYWRKPDVQRADS